MIDSANTSQCLCCTVPFVVTMLDVPVRLLGPAELIQVLGVSRTRFAQLAARDDFPAPIAELAMGKVWDLADIEKWANKRGRALHPLAADHSS